MNIMYDLINLLSAGGEVPPLFGSFHIIAACAVILFSALLVLLVRDSEDKRYRRVVFAIWLTLAILEVLREVVFAYGGMENGAPSFDYQWYLFPFQLCSSPLYLAPFVILLKDGKARRAIMAFLATFSLFGGLVVVIYPPEVLCGITFINYQAFIHHGLQLTLGIITMVRLRGRHTLRLFLGGAAVLAVMMGLAMLLNIVVHNLFVAKGMDDTFNMFYISPYHGCSIPILSVIRELIPYPAFLAVYFLGFTVVAAIIYYLQRLVISIASHRSPAAIRRSNARLRVKARLDEK